MIGSPSRTRAAWKEANRRAARTQSEWRSLGTTRRRRSWLIGGAALAVILFLILIAGIASLSTIRHAKDDLTRAKDMLQGVADDPSSLLNHSGRAADLTSLHNATALAQSAHHALASSVAVGFLNLFPIVHTQTSGAAKLAADAETASQIASGLVSDVDSLAATASISGGHIPLPPLSTLQSEVATAARRMSQLDAPPSGFVGLVGPLGGARDLFDATAQRVSTRLTTAAQDLIAAQAFLGADGPRTYLLVGENNAEMRDQGIPLSYATVSFDGGTFAHTPANDTGSIEPAQPVTIAIPPGTSETFGRFGPTSLWQATNATADFPWSASVMAAMYRAATGTSVDGVIAVDVPALSRILAVIGPVSVQGIDAPLDSSNVADILLNRLYAESPNPASQGTRHDQIAAAASAIFSKLQGSSVADVVDFSDALAKSAAGRHLILWSTHPDEEKIFSQTGIGGEIAGSDPTRTIHLAVENATATKLDYFVQPAIDVDVDITPAGRAVVTTRIRLANTAPAGVAASYQFGPDKTTSFTPGEYVGLVCLWGPAGAVQPGSVRESGLQLEQATARVEAGQAGTVAFSFSIPGAVVGGRFHLRLVPQPRLDPEPLTVTLHAPGWQLTSGQRTVSTDWATTSTLEWGLEKG